MNFKQALMGKPMVFLLFLALFCSVFITNGLENVYAEDVDPSLFGEVKVSHEGKDWTIAKGNTSRNLAVAPDGTIYALYRGDSNGIYVAKSTDRGKTFSERVQVYDKNVEAEVAVSSSGTVYVTWSETVQVGSESIYRIFISKNTDQGNAFTAPQKIGEPDYHNGPSVHLAVDGNYVYVIETRGQYLYSSNDGGVTFNTYDFNESYVYSDVHLDLSTGHVIIQKDKPELRYYISEDRGQSFGPAIDPGGEVRHSVGAVSIGDAGKYLLIAGDGNNLERVNLANGSRTSLEVGNNMIETGRSLSTDRYGNVATGYSDSEHVYFQVSRDLGETFSEEYQVAKTTIANAAINTTNGDLMFLYEREGEIYLKVYDGLLSGYRLFVSNTNLFFDHDQGGDKLIVTVKNTSTQTIQIEDVLVEGDFIVDESTVKLELEPDESMDIVVKFTPKEQGTSTGKLSILVKDEPPRVVLLTGFKEEIEEDDEEDVVVQDAQAALSMADAVMTAYIDLGESESATVYQNVEQAKAVLNAELFADPIDQDEIVAATITLNAATEQLVNVTLNAGLEKLMDLNGAYQYLDIIDQLPLSKDKQQAAVRNTIETIIEPNSNITLQDISDIATLKLIIDTKTGYTEDEKQVAYEALSKKMISTFSRADEKNIQEFQKTENNAIKDFIKANITDPETKQSLRNKHYAEVAARSLTREDAFTFDAQDTWESITKQFLTLSEGPYQTEIAWSSSNEDVITIIDASGDNKAAAVERQDADVSVILTATISKDGQSQQRTFLLIVKNKSFGIKELDPALRNVDVIVGNTSSNPAAIQRINLKDSESNEVVNKIDKLIIDNTIIDNTIIDQQTGDDVVFHLQDHKDDPADEIAVEVSNETLSLFDKDLKIATDQATITLPQDTLERLQNEGQELYLRIVPIRQAEKRQQVIDETLNNQEVKNAAGDKRVNVLGTPRQIETNFSGYKTRVLLPLSDITIPANNEAAFLNSLRIFIQHNDGENKVITGTIERDDANNIIGLSFEIEKFSTFTIIQLEELPSTGSTPGPISETIVANPSSETIVVDIEVGNDVEVSIATKITISRTTLPDKTKQDTVHFTEKEAIETIQKAIASGMTKATIILPDEKDEVSEVEVHLSRQAATKLADAGIDLIIYTFNGRITIPAQSLEGIAEDVYFRLIPIRDVSLKEQVLSRALKEPIVLNVSDTLQPYVVTSPMTIETNMPSRPVSIALPLQGVDIPVTSEQRLAFLNSLAVFIEHSDGDRILTKGNIVAYGNNLEGLEVSVEKFSTFTILSWKGIDLTKLLAANVESEQHHTKYIYGFPDGSFKPNQTVTRAEIATMLARNVGFNASQHQFEHSSFPDVEPSHWASDAIEFVKQSGLMIGDHNGQFKAEAPITRGEMAMIAARWMQLDTTITSSAAFSDTSVHWSSGAVEAIYHAGIIKGYDDGTYRPLGHLSRAEAVTIVNRMFDRGPLNGIEASSWKDVPTTHWAMKDIEEASSDHEYTITPTGEEFIKQ